MELDAESDSPPATQVTLRNVGGWPVCTVTNVCVVFNDPNLNHTKVKLHSNKPPDVYTMSRRPAVLDDVGMRRVSHELNAPLQEENCRAWVKANPGPLEVSKMFDSVTAAKAASALYFEGRTLFSTSFAARVFSHTLQKAVQSHNVILAMQADGQPIDRLFALKQSRAQLQSAEDSALDTFLNLVLDDWNSPEKSLFQNELASARSILRLNRKIMCFDSISEVHSVHARYFAAEEEIPKWQALTDSWFVPRRAKCPSQRVAVLYRQEGAYGIRSLVSYAPLEAALRAAGVCRYENITFSAQDSALDQARALRDVGLLLAPHSAQLLHLLWSAHPLSATLEVRPDQGEPLQQPWSRHPTPYCTDYLCTNIYDISLGHFPKPTSDFRYNLHINETILAVDLERVILRQNTALVAAGCPPRSRATSCP